ncbi:MAG: hypothetical protein KKA16_15380 [Alphaproteobacteria bacterium]|nr:hypothetical protein [Alphaproteobacteria bacterium]MBU2380933.1 hypothetical protein [Alphaproteobacteria bacterium]
MQLNLRDLIASPDHYLFAFEGGQASLMPMDRAAYERSIFLDRRIQPAGQQMARIDAAQLATVLDQARAPMAEIGWIFHVAHCGSTLLARALDGPGDLVLREPVVLRQLAVDAVNAGRDDAWAARLRLALRLLGRRYAPDAPVIAKANVPVNFIVDDLMTQRPDAPAVFLYYPLETYLLAILRSDNHRNWVMGVSTELKSELDRREPCDAPPSAPAIAAARLWLAQIRIYADALNRYPNAVSLDAETLFSRPGPVLQAAGRHFGVAEDTKALEATLAGPLFSTYSKTPGVAFDNAARTAREAEQRTLLAAELTVADQWVRSRLADRPLPDRLDRPLVGPAPVLISAARA